MKDIKAIFFDAGGTLIHLDSHLICDLISADLGTVPSQENFRRGQYLAMLKVAQLVAEGAGSTEKLKAQFYSTLLPEIGVPGGKLEQAVECILKLAHAEMLWRKADESTALTLKKLKERGLILAVVSNSDGRIESALDQAGLTSYFDFFIDSFLVGVEKPDPAIFRLATERASVAPEQAAYVGDLYSVDVVGARAAGLLPILYDPYELNPEADCVRIRRLDELINM
ncbi:MAG TPA: HAD-IA family hydrolase [Blastocatellia bacterium]